MEWISVKDRLPEANKDVIVFCKTNWYDILQCNSSGDFYRSSVGGTHKVTVTHWMPLPKPPEK